MGKEITDSKKIKKIKLLRERGLSLPEISQAVGVSRTTVFRYVREVKILPKFRTEWKIKRGGSRKRKLIKEKEAYKNAKKIVKNLSTKEKALVLSALYWAEGSKKDFGLSNTNPNIIKIFVEGLRTIFNISDDRLRISVRIYEDLDKDKCLNYWSGVTGVAKDKFVSVNILSGKKKGKLPNGMCRVRVTKGGDLLKEIEAINKIVTEKFN